MQKMKTRLTMTLFCIMVLSFSFRPMMSWRFPLPDISMPSLSLQTNIGSNNAVSVWTDSEKSKYILPASLTVIGEEAFYGSAAGIVVFQGNPERIESKAFLHMPSLAKVYVPESIVYIAQDTFDRDSGLILFGAEGSFTASWARDNGFSFETVVLKAPTNGTRIGLTVLPMAVLFSIAALALSIFKSRNNGRKPGEGRSSRPQERAELHSIYYAFP